MLVAELRAAPQGSRRAATGSHLRPAAARPGSRRPPTAARCARTACGCSRAPPCPGLRPRTEGGTDSGYGTCVTPGIVGAKPFCCVYLLDVNASEPIVRPWKPPRNPMKRGRSGHVARELDRALDRLRAGLAEEAHDRLTHRRHFGQPLGQPRHVLVPVVARDVQELVGRRLDRVDDLRVGVARGAHGDACNEIQEPVAVDVPDLGAAAMRHHERIVARDTTGQRP